MYIYIYSYIYIRLKMLWKPWSLRCICVREGMEGVGDIAVDRNWCVFNLVSRIRTQLCCCCTRRFLNQDHILLLTCSRKKYSLSRRKPGWSNISFTCINVGNYCLISYKNEILDQKITFRYKTLGEILSYFFALG